MTPRYMYLVIGRDDEVVAVADSKAQALKDRSWANKHGIKRPYRIERKPYIGAVK